MWRLVKETLPDLSLLCCFETASQFLTHFYQTDPVQVQKVS